MLLTNELTHTRPRVRDHGTISALQAFVAMLGAGMLGRATLGHQEHHARFLTRHWAFVVFLRHQVRRFSSPAQVFPVSLLCRARKWGPVPTTHFHIRWSGGKLDWQAFQTEEEAKADAERLKNSHETYVIEPHDDASCPRCKEIRVKVPVNG